MPNGAYKDFENRSLTPIGHMTVIQLCIYVDATLLHWRVYDLVATLRARWLVALWSGKDVRIPSFNF